MPKTQPILGLDIGSSAIKAVIGEQGRDGKIILQAGIVKPAKGLRRGTVVDMDLAAGQINSVLQSVKDISKNAIRNIYLNVGGVDIRTQISRGIIAVSRANSEIYQDDIDRVIQASEAVNLPSNRMILHTIKKEFIVDGVGDIQDPLGMIGARLEVVSYIIDAFQPAVKNIMKCVEIAGGSISGLIFNPLSSALSVLTVNQRELGVVLIDIGFGSTSIAVYEEGKLLHTVSIPVGGGHITNDLAVALKIPVEVAEKLKVSYGYAISQGVSAKDVVDLKKIDISLKGTPSRKFISEVVESRLNEICDLVNAELKKINRAGKLPGGAVIVGGGSKLPGLSELFKQELKLSTQIGLANPLFFEMGPQNTVDLLESPEYTNVLGLVLWSQGLNPKPSVAAENVVKNALSFLKNFLP